MSERLFVYGTLRRGCDNPWQRRLAREAHWLGAASLAGELYDLGRYPALVIAATSQQRVLGDLYRLCDAVTSWRWLDAYEGCGSADRLPHEYRRQCVRVQLAGGVTAWASVYLYARARPGIEPVPGGDYLAHRARLVAKSRADHG
ncbi:MAG: gamma-glutamylcyclotransferase [Thiotrichales bacterium]